MSEYTPARWLSVQQAAAERGISVKSIRRYIASGILPAERVGPRLIRIRADDLDQLGNPLRADLAVRS